MSAPAGSLSADELRSLREAIETAVLTHARMDAESAAGPDAYLRMVDVCASAALICEQMQKEAVQHARRADHSWATIGTLLGISRQAAQQRFGAGQPDADQSGATRTLHAVVSNEMQILKAEGAAGYHLVDFGLYYLQVAASPNAWEHRREIALNIRARRASLEAEGWTYVGAWLPFHYFKRQAGML